MGEGSTLTAKDTHTVVLVGRTGNGKSATGNSILGRKAFKSRPSSSAVTDKCEMESAVLEDGTCFNVIDTPGLFDYSDGGSEVLGKEIVRCLDLAKGGIHAFLLVFSIRTRFSQEEGAVLRNLGALFGHDIIDYMIIIFTGGDELEDMEVMLDEYLGNDCPEPLRKIIGLCGNRVVVFNNKTDDGRKKDAQFQQLSVLLKLVMAQNVGKPYAPVPRAIEVDALTGNSSSKQELNQLKEQVNKAYEEKLSGMSNMMTEAAKKLEEQLDKEKAARAEAEEIARKCQKKSEEEMLRLQASLENATMEAAVLSNIPPPPTVCAIL